MEGVTRWEVEAAEVTVGLQVTRPRSAPWLRIVRVPRFGRGLGPQAVSDILGRLVRLTEERPVLRVHVEVWSEDETEREMVATACQRWNFQRTAPRNYTKTVWFDISAPEEELLLSFHRSVRRNVRIPGKKGMVVSPITDLAAIPRVREIFSSTFDRTGGTPPFLDWEVMIGANGRPGCHYHLVGLFQDEDADPSGLLAFAVAFLHGDVAEFAHAGSVRDPEIRVPLLYAPTWDLMLWARSRGAQFWDFGGIPSDTEGDQGPLAGISSYKRCFRPEVREVGEEWVLEPRRWASTLVRVVSKLC